VGPHHRGSRHTNFPPLFNDEFTDRAYEFYDVNDSGQMIGLRYDGSIFLYDDGTFYDIKLPTGLVFAGLGGLNNKGQFVGSYRKQVGIDPYYGWPIYETHGFIARPAPTHRK
jgi:hypothetical protein